MNGKFSKSETAKTEVFIGGAWIYFDAQSSNKDCYADNRAFKSLGKAYRTRIDGQVQCKNEFYFFKYA